MKILRKSNFFLNSGAKKAITELKNTPEEFSNRLEQT